MSQPDLADSPSIYSQLPRRHQAFVDGIARGLSQIDAYLAVYPGSTRTAAYTSASELANSPDVAAAIEEQRAQLSAHAALSRDEYVAGLKQDAGFDPLAMFEPNTLEVLPLSQWPEPLRKCVAGLEVHEVQSKIGIRKTVKVRFIDRLKAKELLGRTLGFFDHKDDGSKFELHINLSQLQVQAQAQGPMPPTESHSFGPVTLNLPKEAES